VPVSGDVAPTAWFASHNVGSGVIELAFDTLMCMSTKDELLYSALHSTAMRYAAERRNLDKSIEELRQIADSRNDILAEAAGIGGGLMLCCLREGMAKSPESPRQGLSSQ
jgi:hypothetical protein